MSHEVKLWVAGKQTLMSLWATSHQTTESCYTPIATRRGHLEELTAAFRMLFGKSPVNEPIVVDLGCGPCTGGLAIAGALGEQPSFDYIGVDRSSAHAPIRRTVGSVCEPYG